MFCYVSADEYSADVPGPEYRGCLYASMASLFDYGFDYRKASEYYSRALEYVNKVHRRAYGYDPDQPSPVDYASLQDRTYAMPIPTSEFESNPSPGMVQTPGY